MEFIGAYWWLWLLLMLIFGTYAVHNQLKRIKKMMDKDLSGDAKKDIFRSAFSGMGSVILVGALAMGAWGLFLLSVVINLIAHFSKH